MRVAFFALVTHAAFTGGGRVAAADATWVGPLPGDWATGTNWSPASAPGTTAGTANADTATFNSAGGVVTVDAYRNLQNLVFNGGTTAGWTLSGGTLRLSSGGSILMINSGGTAVHTIGSAIVLEGDGGAYSFTNNSTSAARVFNMAGAISGVSTAGNTTTLTLNGTGGTNTQLISGAISDGGNGGRVALVRDQTSGTGVWALTGANTFTGGVTLNAGRLGLGNATALGSGTLVINGGTVAARNNVTLLTTNNAMVWNGSFTMDNSGGTGSGNLNLGTGNVTLGASITITTNSNTYTVGGAIDDGANSYGLTKAGNSSLILSGSNSYGGDTVVTGGSLAIAGGANRLPTATNLILGSGTTGGTFNLNGQNQTVAGLFGSGTVPGTVQNGAVLTTSTLTVTGASTFGGVLRNNSGSGGTLALTKSTGGTLTLTGTNTYTGATTINGGTLLVNGSLASASAVAVNSGGTLGGNGGVGAVTLNNGGALAAGDGVGTLSANSLLWNAGGVLKFELGGASDLLAVSGALVKGGNGSYLFEFVEGTGFGVGTYTLVNFGSTTFAETDFSYTGLSGSFLGDFVRNGGSLQFTVTAVPEPSVLAVFGFGLGFLYARRRLARRL